MNQIVPPALLCDFLLQVSECPRPSKRRTGRLLKLDGHTPLFQPAVMEAESENFSEIKVGWNPDGLALQVTISGKQHPVAGSSAQLGAADHILIWTDTRPSGNVHRATEYCQHFAIVPVDEHDDGAPSVSAQPIAQQRQSRLEPDVKKMLTRTHIRKDGYDLELWIPGGQLYGFREITETRRMGFYCVVRDSELGDQHLSVDDSFPYSYDPSLWVQLELTS